MTIEKNNVKVVAAAVAEVSVGSRSRESMSSDEDDSRRKNSVDSEDDDGFDDADSGAGSDDFDLLELGETGSEFCQVGDQTCCLPFELYDLPDLYSILSLDVWNDCLTEDERFGLTQYLPDMDEETFMRTLKDLFEGANFLFGSPITMLYRILKGGMCEPRVALYRQGLRFFQTHQHYHLLRRHHDSMVSSLLQMKEAWKKCQGYSIQEKLRVLNIVRSQKSLMGERNDDLRSDSSERESGEALLKMRLRGCSAGKRTGRDFVYGDGPAFDIYSGGSAGTGDTTKYGQPNAKGLLNLKKGGLKNPIPSVASSRITSGLHGRQGSVHGSNMGRSRGGMVTSGNAEQEMIYNMATEGYLNGMDGNVIIRDRSVKLGKKHEAFGDVEGDGDSYTYLHQSGKTAMAAHGRNLNINQLSDIKVLTAKPSNVRCLNDPSRRSNYVDPAHSNHTISAKWRATQMAIRGNPTSYADIAEPYLIQKTKGDAYVTEPSYDYEYRDVNPRAVKLGNDFCDSRLKSLQASQHMEDEFFYPEKRAKLLKENMRGTALRNGGSNIFSSKSNRMFHGVEESQSDSSDQHEDEEDNIPLIMSKQAIRSRMETSRSSMSRSSFDEKMKRTKKGVKENQLISEEMLPNSSTIASFGRYMSRPELEVYSSRSRQKVMMHNLDTSQNFNTRLTEDGYYGGSGNWYIKNDKNSTYRLGRNSQVLAEGSPMSMNKASPLEKRKKGNVGLDCLHQSNDRRDYMEHDGAFFDVNPIDGTSRDLDATVTAGASFLKKKQKRKKFPTEIDGLDGSNYLPSHQQFSDSVPLKNWAKERLEVECGSAGASTSEVPILEVVMAEPEVEVKPQKKILPPITPTIHTGFSFSIIHLLSAVRIALITPSPDNSQKHIENNGVEVKEQSAKHESANGSLEQLDMTNQSTEKSNVQSLTVQDIVNRVRSDPGDPCILETQEPLQDLVRGVLKLFSSKTAPLGAKGWKPLICYEKSSKGWSWTGPVPPSEADHETPEEVISPEAWCVSRKMLVKLVDSYANWLKSGQETLKQIGSLPPPPLELMQQNFDEKERFKDLRAQKSLITINRSSDEVRDYFRKEEHLRYLVPDRTFSYTAADGKKSIVAPLRRCGGKPTSKARDHFMLKRDRPPHVTVLCLVRDAAARLPGSIGTRADVCTLIRDSQYIVEDVTDSQINQVVSGALDRLHYERDPCVQFDGERKLWVYLHREREEEDFEDDGTSSTKKWRRPKKDASEQDDQVTVVCHGNIEPNGLDSDLNVAPTCANGEKTSNTVYDDTRQRMEDEGKTVDMAGEADFQHILESQLHSQENSTNEEINDET